MAAVQAPAAEELHIIKPGRAPVTRSRSIQVPTLTNTFSQGLSVPTLQLIEPCIERRNTPSKPPELPHFDAIVEERRIPDPFFLNQPTISTGGFGNGDDPVPYFKQQVSTNTK